MMKKLLALLLAAVLLLSATGCAVNNGALDAFMEEGAAFDDDLPAESDDVVADETPESDPRVDVTPDTTTTTAKKPTTTTTTTKKPTTTTTTKKVDSTPKFTLGTVKGQVYENTFLGLGCRVPADWVYYTEEEIKQLNGQMLDAVGDELAQLMENADTIYTMHTVQSDGFRNMNMVLQNMGLRNVNVAASLQASLDASRQALENIGCQNVDIRVTKVSFLGKTVDGLVTQAEVNGVKMYQRAACFMSGKYMVSVTATCYSEDTTQGMLNMFYKLG